MCKKEGGQSFVNYGLSSTRTSVQLDKASLAALDALGAAASKASKSGTWLTCTLRVPLHLELDQVSSGVTVYSMRFRDGALCLAHSRRRVESIRARGAKQYQLPIGTVVHLSRGGGSAVIGYVADYVADNGRTGQLTIYKNGRVTVKSYVTAKISV